MNKKLNESPQLVNQKLYSNLKFEDGVVVNSVPSKDKINPSLLSDIETAAKKAGVIASITTAVSGHDEGTRHEKGNAVDISKFDGKGFVNLEDAKKKGIYDKMYRFFNVLIEMGYVFNKESGNDKSILSFGFKGHDDHVHVSRNSDDGTNSSNGTDDETSIDPKFDVYGGITNTLTGGHGAEAFKKSGEEIWNKTMGKIQKAMKESVNDNSSKLDEEINRIKKIMK